MFLPTSAQLAPRATTSDTSKTNSSHGNTAFIAVGVAVAVLLLASAGSYIILRRLRAQNRSPTYLPTSFLKQRWYSWSPRSKYGKVSSGDANSARSRSGTNTAYNPNSTSTEDSAATAAAAAGVDRNTSVRSVMTLPSYAPTPRETEQVIGREGERAGMDTVVEFPETVDETELRREEEMESLFQIRQARRQEIVERDQRREARQEARARGDRARLEELTRESRARAEAASLGREGANGSTTNLSAAVLLAEHQSRGRDRRVSEVTYASLGNVRHDGSRLRANSNESERGGLLDDAAAMGETEGRNRAGSGGSSIFGLPRPHFRDRSTSSVLSISTTASDLENRPPIQTTPPSTRDGGGSSRGQRNSDESEASAPNTSHSSPNAIRLTPEASTGSDDPGESAIPLPEHEPPTYEQTEWGDAPAYTSPVLDRSNSRAFAEASRARTEDAENRRRQGLPTRINTHAPRLPQVDTLPSIEVDPATEPNTPASPSGTGR